MDERGVDMHKVRDGKAEVALWGMEHLKRAKKKEAAVIEAGKDVVKQAGEKSASILKPNEDESLRKWKRELIYGRSPQT